MKLNWSNKKHRCALTTFFLIVLFLLSYPNIIEHLEANQLFLWNMEYLRNGVLTIGGVSKYIGELLAQFFLIIPLGALLFSILLCCIQLSFWKILKQLKCKDSFYPISIVPSILMAAMIANGEHSLTFVVAMLIVMLLMMMLPANRTEFQISGFIISIIAFCLAGPVALITLPYLIRKDQSTRHNILIVVAWGINIALSGSGAYHWTQTLYGVYYTFFPSTLPIFEWFIIAITALLMLIAPRYKKLFSYQNIVIIALLLALIPVNHLNTILWKSNASMGYHIQCNAEEAIENKQNLLALRYINVLKETLFYKTWAEEKEQLLKKEKLAQSNNYTPFIYPDYTEVTIPSDIAPLNFTMADDSFSNMRVEVKGSKGGSIVSEGSYTDFDIDEWHQLTRQNQGGKLTVSVNAEKDGKWKQFDAFNIYVSNTPLDQWGIVYQRDIKPFLLQPQHHIIEEPCNIGLYQRNLSNFDETAILRNTKIDNSSIFFPSANATNPEQLAFKVTGRYDCTYIHHHGKNKLLDEYCDVIQGSMEKIYWHPRGNYFAFTKSGSDIYVYDVVRNKIILDTLLVKENKYYNCPAFSADGKWLYFTSRKHRTAQKFNQYYICRAGFNAKQGTFNGKIDTLFLSTTKDKCITSLQPSYDGRYMMYSQTDIEFEKPDTKYELWLLDLKTLAARPLTEINSNHFDDNGNWSKNSHWFMFNSQREDGKYSKIYLSSIDSNGHATKPFLLPQRYPKQYGVRTLLSYQYPIFISKKVRIEERLSSTLIRSKSRAKAELKQNNR